MHVDKIIRGGTLVNSSGFQKADIGITKGMISAITLPGELHHIADEIDGSGKYVIPGVIDSHVHLREPGLTDKEDFASGTKAAAAGGVTTIMVMPFNKPIVTSVKELEEKAEIACGRAFVDYTLQATIRPSAINNISDIVKWGVTSFEILLAEAPGEIAIKNNGQLSSILEEASKKKVIVGVYADDDGIIEKFTSSLKLEGRNDFMAHQKSKPCVGEALGIARACLIAESIGARIHFRQVSTKIGVDILRVMKKCNNKISAEVSPHHLLLDARSIDKMEPYAKVNPPLRDREDCEALWKGLKDGTIDIIATDHAPHTPKEKETGYDNIWCAPAGINGLQTMLPLLLNRVFTNQFSLPELVASLCEKPAKLFGLYPRKGVIKIGSDADLVVVDPEKHYMVSAKDQYSKAKHSPFEGTKLQGMPVLSILRGNVIMKDGVVSDNAKGKLIKKPI